MADLQRPGGELAKQTDSFLLGSGLFRFNVL